MSLRSDQEDSDQGAEDDTGQDDTEEVEMTDCQDDKEQETVICWATAIADHIPSPYDTEGLSFKTGHDLNIKQKYIKTLFVFLNQLLQDLKDLLICRSNYQDSSQIRDRRLVWRL